MAVKKKNIGSGLLFFAVQVACPTGSPASYTWSVSVHWEKKKKKATWAECREGV